jgi:hypothetical protein
LFEACEAIWIGLLSLRFQIGRGVEDFAIKILLKEDSIRGNTPFDLNCFEGPHKNDALTFHEVMFGGLDVFFALLIKKIFSHKDVIGKKG